MAVNDVSIAGYEFRMETHDRGDRYISREIQECAAWEPFESSILAGLLQPGHVLLDLGANIGYYTILGSLACGTGGEVYAFEPEPRNFALLERNVALNSLGNVTAVNAAAGATQGSTRLFLSEDNQGDHRLYDNEARATSITVPQVRLDQWFAGRPGRIDVVKMDTQGCEAHIVAGMSGLIEANRDRLHLIIEFWPFGLEGAGSSAAALADQLRTFGFKVGKIEESTREVVPTTWETLLAEANDFYHPATQRFTNLLLSPER